MDIYTEHLRNNKEWIFTRKLELIDKLIGKFPEIYFPDDDFYANWDGSEERLNVMLAKILEWLKEPPLKGMVAYLPNLPSAGLFTTPNNRENILIKSEFRNNAFVVSAILAHECMHLYMRRHGMEIYGVAENELYTDLATIYSGLGILITNGMKYNNYWYLTAIVFLAGYIFVNEEKKSFGYFTADEYGQYFADYLNFLKRGKKNVSIKGFIHPQARSFVYNIDTLSKGKNKKLKVIATAEQKQLISFFGQVILVGTIATGFLIYLFLYRK